MITEGKGRHAPSPETRILSKADAMLCMNAAMRISQFRNYRQSRNSWKRGLMGEFVTIPLVGTIRGDVAPYFIGFTAEIALIDLLNRRTDAKLSFDDSLRSGGDGGADLTAFGLTIQIKGRQSDRPHAKQRLNLVRHSTGDGRLVFPRASVLAFCETDIATLRVSLLGWMYSVHAKKLPIVPARRGSHKNVEIPDAMLRPISALVDSVAAHKGLNT